MKAWKKGALIGVLAVLTLIVTLGFYTINNHDDLEYSVYGVGGETSTDTPPPEHFPESPIPTTPPDKVLFQTADSSRSELTMAVFGGGGHIEIPELTLAPTTLPPETTQLPTTTPPTTTSPPSTLNSWHEVTSFSAKGNRDTVSFYIMGETVKIIATTCCGSGSGGTYSAIRLKREEGGYLGAGLSILTEGSEEGRGEMTYRNLKKGQYYISVITGVNWEVKIEEYY